MTIIKKCEYCKEEFRAKQKRQKYCNNNHYKECPICHDMFLLKNNRETKTCSNICAKAYRDRYIYYRKKCHMCGKIFQTNTKHAKFCKDKHYRNCLICDTEFEVKDLHRPARVCSHSCASTLSHTEESKAKRRTNSLDKYGVEHPFQSEEVKRKIERSLENYESNTRIGSPKWRRNIKDKYGVINVSQMKSVKRKKRETYYKRYGVYNPAAMQAENYKEWNNLRSFIENKGENWDSIDLAEYFNLNVGSIRDKAKQLGITHLIKDFYKYSSPELNVKRILKELELIEGIDFFPHVRNVISPKELDFYIPRLNIAIEVSPTYTHNSSPSSWFAKGGKALCENYHMDKYEECRKKGIQLITIFDWIDIEDLKSYLSYVLNSKSVNKEELTYEEIVINKRVYCNVKKDETIVANAIWHNSKHESRLCKFEADYHSPELLSFMLDNYLKSNLCNDVSKFTIIADSSFELKSVYEKYGFHYQMNFNPKLRYHHIGKDIYVKSRKTISNKRSVLEKNNFLPIFDCGSSKWTLNKTADI